MLNKIKLYLGIDSEDKVQDELLSLIASNTKQQLKLYLKLKSAEEIPPELEFIIVDVAVMRYNRIGNEGMSSVTVEGHSMTFSNHDFSAYDNILEDYRYDDRDGYRKHGKVVML